MEEEAVTHKRPRLSLRHELAVATKHSLHRRASTFKSHILNLTPNPTIPSLSRKKRALPPRERTTFLSLPPEIRNQIYHLAFSSSLLWQASAHFPDPDSNDSPNVTRPKIDPHWRWIKRRLLPAYLLILVIARLHSPFRTAACILSFRNSLPCGGAALLRVSSQVSHEAEAILYGGFRFVFTFRAFGWADLEPELTAADFAPGAVEAEVVDAGAEAEVEADEPVVQRGPKTSSGAGERKRLTERVPQSLKLARNFVGNMSASACENMRFLELTVALPEFPPSVIIAEDAIRRKVDILRKRSKRQWVNTAELMKNSWKGLRDVHILVQTSRGEHFGNWPKTKEEQRADIDMVVAVAKVFGRVTQFVNDTDEEDKTDLATPLKVGKEGEGRSFLDECKMQFELEMAGERDDLVNLQARMEMLQIEVH